IEAANATPEGDVIAFAPDLEGGTMQLELGEMLITGDVEIVGPGAAGVTVEFRDVPPVSDEGELESRTSGIEHGSSERPVDSTLGKLTFVGGFTPTGGGGAISSVEALSVYDSSFYYNVARYGGAIAVAEGRLGLHGTTTVGNSTARIPPLS